MVAAAVIGGAVIGGVATSRAGSKAANVQQASTEAGIGETRYEFDEAKKILKPYVDAGTDSLSAQKDLIGLNGPEAQAKALAGIQESPQFQAMVQQGEEGILQNASATGGLRGGNTQAALAQFRPAVLSSLIDSQFSKLSGITQLGQASAAGQASAGISTGANIAQLLQAGGAAKAGNAIAQGQGVGQIGNSLATAAILSNMNSNGGKVF